MFSNLINTCHLHPKSIRWGPPCRSSGGSDHKQPVFLGETFHQPTAGQLPSLREPFPLDLDAYTWRAWPQQKCNARLTKMTQEQEPNKKTKVDQSKKHDTKAQEKVTPHLRHQPGRPRKKTSCCIPRYFGVLLPTSLDLLIQFIHSIHSFILSLSLSLSLCVSLLLVFEGVLMSAQCSCTAQRTEALAGSHENVQESDMARVVHEHVFLVDVPHGEATLAEVAHHRSNLHSHLTFRNGDVM